MRKQKKKIRHNKQTHNRQYKRSIMENDLLITKKICCDFIMQSITQTIRILMIWK